MKFRQTAVPGDPKMGNSAIPQNEKVYLKVKYGEDKNTVTKTFWFPQDILTGKVHDILIQHFRLSPTQAKLVRSYLSPFYFSRELTNFGLLDRYLRRV